MASPQWHKNKGMKGETLPKTKESEGTTGSAEASESLKAISGIPKGLGDNPKYSQSSSSS